MRRDFIQAFDKDHISAAAGRLWDAELSSLVRLRIGSSLIYKMSARGVDLILRIVPESYRSSEQVLAELNFVTYLGGSGLRVIPPVPSRHDRWVEVLDTSLGRFSACCFSFIASAAEGAPWLRDPQAHSGEFGEMGRAIGHLHQLSKDYRPQGPRRLRWDDNILVKDPWEDRYFFEPRIRDERRSILDWLHAQSEEPDRFGLVHGDLTGWNVAVDEAGIHIFDFAECCYHWYMFDLCLAMMPLVEVSKPLRSRMLDVLLEGYAEEATLPPHPVKDIEMLWRWNTLDRHMHHMRREESDGTAPWLENQRRRTPFPIEHLAPWRQNHLVNIRQQMFGRVDF